MPRPIRVSIDLEALRHNHAVARRHAGEARVWSVIKADAYGHGVLRAAHALADVADGFALLDFGDAVALREAGLRQPILMLEGFFTPEDLTVIAEQRLTAVVHSREQLAMLARASLPNGVDVYVKVNSGMNRLGFAPGELRAAVGTLLESGRVGRWAFMTHFADADGERGVSQQLACFQAAVAPYGRPASVANSAALLRYPETHIGWVRPGIMLYGASPCPELMSAQAIGLRPVMTLSSEVIALHAVQPGERVGYGGLYEARMPRRIATVACGYADGYPRHAPGGTPVLVEGRRCPLVGRVSMDMIGVDVSDVPDVRVGSRVVLWGEGLPADEVAASAGTISYELFCAIARRVPRIEAGR